ncbi:MAG: hypothetical protein OHK0022_28320 [Roseiflexaceae bacterium]
MAKYISRISDFAYPPPLTHQGARVCAFPVAADHEKLVAFCRRYFDQPSGGAACYYPITNHVLLTVGNIDKIFCNSQPIGSSSEGSIVFWILTAAGKYVGDFFVPERLAWFPGYISVDNPFSLVGGREVFGFFKGFCRLDGLPDSSNPYPQRLAADIYGLKDLEPESRTQFWPLLELSRVSDGDETLIGKKWDTPGQLFQHIWSLLPSPINPIIIPNFHMIASLIEDLFRREVLMLFLKQFRDAKSDDDAAYQAIIEAPADIKRFSASYIGKYQFTFDEVASYPFATELGINNQTEHHGILLDMDFVVNQGKEVWKAGV